MKMAPHCLLVAALALLSLPGRADAPEGHFVASSGVVTDTRTILQWAQDEDQTEHTWEDAIAHCGALSLEGDDWRLPTVKELQTIVDHDLSRPSSDPLFIGLELQYWSVTESWGQSGSAWAVDFNVGAAYADDKSLMKRARCVR